MSDVMKRAEEIKEEWDEGSPKNINELSDIIKQLHAENERYNSREHSIKVMLNAYSAPDEMKDEPITAEDVIEFLYDIFKEQSHD